MGKTLEYGLYLVGPAILTGMAAFLIQLGLRRSHARLRWQTIVGLVVLVIPCLWLIGLASSGNLGGPIAFILAIIASIVAVVSGLWMAWTLPKWRKLSALFLGVVFPVALFASISIGDARSPESITRQDSQAIVKALQAYYTAQGQYPSALEELTPKYLDSLPDDPKSEGGWLYTQTGNDYSLGYVYWVDQLGYSVCLITSSAQDWNCLPGSSGPFVLGPTPMPTRSQSK